MTLTQFIIDCETPSISTSELRERYKQGKYGKINPDHARGYFKLAGRTTK